MKRAAGAAQVLVVVGIDHRLVIHGGVDGGGTALLYAEGVVQYLDHRYQTVGGAGTRSHNHILGIQLVVVDSEHHGAVHIGFAWLGKQQALGARLDVFLRCDAVGVGAGAFQHQAYVQQTPGQITRARVAQHPDAIAVDHQVVAIHRRLTVKPPVGGVVLGQVGDGVDIRQLVDRDHLKLVAIAVFIPRPQHALAKAAVPV